MKNLKSIIIKLKLENNIDLTMILKTILILD